MNNTVCGLLEETNVLHYVINRPLINFFLMINSSYCAEVIVLLPGSPAFVLILVQNL